MFSNMSTDSFITYKKLVNTLKTSFEYNLQEHLIGVSSITGVKDFKREIELHQELISESSYEYSNPKYKRNIIILEALDSLIKIMEIRSYRIDPKTGSLVNYATPEEKLKTLMNPKDNRPDLYFTADHLNIQEPIAVVGNDDMDIKNSVTNAANQVAPHDNMKKAEVYVGVNDGNPNYSTPTNTAEEEKLAGLTSVDIANIADRVKKEVKKDLAKDMSDAALLQKRKNAEVKENKDIKYPTPHYPIGMIMQITGCDAKTAHEVVDDMRYMIGGSGTLDHLSKKEFNNLALRAFNGIKELGEGKMSGNKIIQKLLESEIEKAEIVLGVKSLTDELQKMAEKISKMQVEDLAALTERIKAEHGVEAGEKFQADLGGFLNTALTSLQTSKSSIDNEALVLSGDSQAAASMAKSPLASNKAPVSAAPEADSTEAPGGTEEEDLFGGHEANAGEEEAPLGRSKKDESVNLKKKEFNTLTEKWDEESKTNPKKKGMWDGWTKADLEKERSRLKKKEKRSKAESTKLKEINYAIRAKSGWGKVNESSLYLAMHNELLNSMDHFSIREFMEPWTPEQFLKLSKEELMKQLVGFFHKKVKEKLGRNDVKVDIRANELTTLFNNKLVPEIARMRKELPAMYRSIVERMVDELDDKMFDKISKLVFGKQEEKNKSSLLAAVRTLKTDKLNNLEEYLRSAMFGQEINETVSRKHFQQVADLLKNIPDEKKRKELAKHHADIFKSQNPRFDHSRFYSAANVKMDEDKTQKNFIPLDKIDTRHLAIVCKKLGFDDIMCIEPEDLNRPAVRKNAMGLLKRSGVRGIDVTNPNWTNVIFEKDSKELDENLTKNWKGFDVARQTVDLIKDKFNISFNGKLGKNEAVHKCFKPKNINDSNESFFSALKDMGYDCTHDFPRSDEDTYSLKQDNATIFIIANKRDNSIRLRIISKPSMQKKEEPNMQKAVGESMERGMGNKKEKKEPKAQTPKDTAKIISGKDLGVSKKKSKINEDDSMNNLVANVKDALMYLKIQGEDKVATNVVFNEFKKRGIEISLEQLQEMFPQGNDFIKNITSAFVEFNNDEHTAPTPMGQAMDNKAKVSDMAVKAANKRS